MKTQAVKAIALVLAGSLQLGALCIRAETTGTVDQERMDQQSIQVEVEMTRQKISVIRAELIQSDATKEEIKALDGVLAKLESLASEQMKNVIGSLETASEVSDSAFRRKALLEAYEGQRKILDQISALGQQLRLRNSLREFQERTRKLLLEQITTVRLTEEILAYFGPAGELEKGRQKLAITRQAAIERQIGSLAQYLELEASQGNGDEKKNLQAALELMTKSGVRTVAKGAAQRTAEYSWMLALPAQKQVKEILAQLALLWQASSDPVDNLQQALQILGELAADQKQLVAYTWAVRTPEGLAEQLRQQRTLLDTVATWQGLIMTLNAGAGQKLEQAKNFMNGSVESLLKNNADGSAAKIQEQALKQIELAISELQQQLKKNQAEAQDAAQAATQKNMNDAQAAMDAGLKAMAEAKLPDAAKHFTEAERKVEELMNTAAALPAGAQAALKQAQQESAAAAENAAQGKSEPAKQDGQQGAEALAQAKEALEKGAGTAKAQQGGKSPTPGTAEDQETGLLGSSGADAARGSAQVAGALKAKEREALCQLSKEKVPEEYSGLVRQYYKNLSTESGAP